MKSSEFSELKAFMCVAQQHSFRRAAEILGMSPSALSHTIRALEERLGTRLLNRTTRSVATTEAGQALLERLAPAVEEISSAVREAGASQVEPRGRIRINLPRVAARLLITPMLPLLREKYPRLSLDVVIDDTISDIVGKGFDVGIRSGELVQQDMIAVRLTPDLRMVVVGSPGYFSRFPEPRHPQDLRLHQCVTYRWDATGVLQRWKFRGPEGAILVNVESIITANETDFVLDAALRDTGLAYISEQLAKPYIEKGELIQVLNEWSAFFSGFHLYYVNNPHMSASLRAFIDLIKSFSTSADSDWQS